MRVLSQEALPRSNAYGSQSLGCKTRTRCHACEAPVLSGLASCNTLANSQHRLAISQTPHHQTQNDPHKLRRLRRATGPQRATMRWEYARALYRDNVATLDDHREAVTTLEDVERTARRVLGGAHPLTTAIEKCLRNARARLALVVGLAPSV